MNEDLPGIIIVIILTAALWNPFFDATHDAGLTPECEFIKAMITEKVYPIPGTDDTYGIVILVDDEVSSEFDGRYGIIVSEPTYNSYYVGDEFTQFVCTIEEYERIIEFVQGLIDVDLLHPGNNYG